MTKYEIRFDSEDSEPWRATLDIGGWTVEGFDSEGGNELLARMLNDAFPLEANGAAHPVAIVGGEALEFLQDEYSTAKILELAHVEGAIY